MTDTHTEALVERVARKLAAIKMGLREDVNGERLPDELWSQCIFEARAAIEALPARNDERALKLVEALRSAGEQMLSDYQTSEQHHPNHVLVPLRAFEDLRSALADTQPSSGSH